MTATDQNSLNDFVFSSPFWEMTKPTKRLRFQTSDAPKWCIARWGCLFIFLCLLIFNCLVWVVLKKRGLAENSEHCNDGTRQAAVFGDPAEHFWGAERAAGRVGACAAGRRCGLPCRFSGGPNALFEGHQARRPLDLRPARDCCTRARPMHSSVRLQKELCVMCEPYGILLLGGRTILWSSLPTSQTLCPLVFPC